MAAAFTTAATAAVLMTVPLSAAQAAPPGHPGQDGRAVAAASGRSVDAEPLLPASGTFAAPGRHGVPRAVTYDRSVVPEGARVTVEQRTGGGRTAVRLAVRGVEPERAYGAHVHTRPCGAAPADSGPHYQHREDPLQPSTDPSFANPYNEVWLDLTTGPEGAGEATAWQQWSFRVGEARSVVLHERPTRAGHGEAGTAGGRLACFTVPFAPA